MDGSLLFFVDDIVLVADSEEELQRILDVLASYGEKWKFTFNHNKCGMLVIGQEKQNKRELGKETSDEVDEYKYLEIWINRQADGLNHV